jgi:Kef-type K+ transport system membrane component KefB/Trk K+ transport system NAD-binding subunit
MEETRSFIPLLIVVFLAFVVPLILSRFKRIRLPIVVGEILAGIIVGRSGFGLIQNHDPVLDLLAGFGFVFLMFLSGMEIDFSNINLSRNGQSRPKGKNQWGPVPLGVLSFLITLSFAVMIGIGMWRFGLVRNPWMMALILSTTSLGVVMPVLKERGLIGGQFGQAVLISALIADFATMLLITVVVAILSTGLTLDILLITLLFVVFFLIYHFGMMFFNRVAGVRRAMDELSHASAQIKVRAAFTMMLIFVVLSEVLGTELILGAFLGGVVIALLRTPQDAADLSPKLEAIGFGFFIPIFFIMVGVDFNLQVLLDSPDARILVPILLVAAFGVKAISALIFRLKYSWRETFAAGSLLSARLSLIIAASAIGLRLGVIGEAVNSAIILVAIITVTVSPLIFMRLAPERETGQPRPILIAGAGDLGLRVAEQLRAHHEQVLVLDADENRVARARQRGLEAQVAELDRPGQPVTDLLEKAQALVCTYMDVELNFRICRLAHTTYGIEQIIAQVNEPVEMARFRQLGVTAMNAAVDRAAMLAMMVRNPAAYNLLTRVDDDKEVTEVVVGAGECLGKALRELKLPGDVLVLALRRDGELLVPHGNTRLSLHDHLTLAGSIDYVEMARQRLVGG